MFNHNYYFSIIIINDNNKDVTPICRGFLIARDLQTFLIDPSSLIQGGPLRMIDKSHTRYAHALISLNVSGHQSDKSTYYAKVLCS